MTSNPRVGVRSVLLASQPGLDALGVKPAFPVPPPDAFWSVLVIKVDCVFGGGTVMCVVGVVRGLSVLVCVLQMKVPGSFPAL